MVVFVVCCAALNLLLGAVLAWLFPPESIWPAAAAALFEGRQREAHGIVYTSPSDGGSATNPYDADLSTTHGTSRAASDAAPNDPQRPRPPSKPAPARNWAEFDQQLRDLRQRIRYCRPALNMKLARQAAGELKSCALIWYAQFAKCVSGEPLDEATQALVQGADASAIELLAAQIETSITNLGAVDFSGRVDDALNAIERELDLIDDQQKKVKGGKKKLAAAR
jgi:hypothetical protein